MTCAIFSYPPSPEVLQWLAGGHLESRLLRTMRLWVLLTHFYGPANWSATIPAPFRYPPIRDHLFASSHSKDNELTATKLVQTCTDLSCICHQSLQTWLEDHDQDIRSWSEKIRHLTGLSPEEIENLCHQCPFATVHRSLRDDLKHLSQMGWLHSQANGYYHWKPPEKWPAPPFFSAQTSLNLDQITLTLPLNSNQLWQFLKVLESISFIQPDLEIIIQSLWEQLTAENSNFSSEPSQRIFIHLDYILPPETQDRVDTYQEQLEKLWSSPPPGVIKFNYWFNPKTLVNVIVYPVCLHYLRRTKYLSAYGLDPEGKINWHNYRLDRISSPNLQVLAWGDPQIPLQLREKRRRGELPTPEEVQTQLDKAWGFNFYHPKELLILRFRPEFADWYVENTHRHPTFKKVQYQTLFELIKNQIPNLSQRGQIKQILSQRLPTDAYYIAWVRINDINILMRLRDWRPNGEVIAPLSYRQRLAQEVKQEAEYLGVTEFQGK